jgi:hypothetical protein
MDMFSCYNPCCFSIRLLSGGWLRIANTVCRDLERESNDHAWWRVRNSKEIYNRNEFGCQHSYFDEQAVKYWLMNFIIIHKQFLFIWLAGTTLWQDLQNVSSTCDTAILYALTLQQMLRLHILSHECIYPLAERVHRTIILLNFLHHCQEISRICPVLSITTLLTKAVNTSKDVCDYI